MDPLSVTASVLSIIMATIATVNTLQDTVKRYKGRDKTLGRLQGGLLDLIAVLTSLEAAADEAVADGEAPVLGLLKGPVGRCAQVCRDFEDAMKKFSGKSKTGLTDWAKMEFMRGDINEFIDILGDYKSTITIGLGTITMNTSRLTQQVVGEYSEIIKDTAFSLEMRLRHIDEKIASIVANRPMNLEDSRIDLQDEKSVTVQCLRICENASAYITSLQDRQPTLQREAPQQSAEQSAGYILNQFEAQVLTQKSLTESRDNMMETIGRLRERLDFMASDEAPDGGRETLRLQEERNFSRQCLEVCKQASTQVSTQKIHIIGEVIAEEDCDQVVVTSLADLFNVGKVKATNRSAQLVGSMQPDVLQQLSKDRYGSRFGAMGGNLGTAQPNPAVDLPSTSETRTTEKSRMKSNQTREDGESAGPETPYDRPSPNEVRRRRAGYEDAPKKNGHE